MLFAKYVPPRHKNKKRLGDLFLGITKAHIDGIPERAIYMHLPRKLRHLGPGHMLQPWLDTRGGIDLAKSRIGLEAENC